jgi:hypothetical protein
MDEYAEYFAGNGEPLSARESPQLPTANPFPSLRTLQTTARGW